MLNIDLVYNLYEGLTPEKKEALLGLLFKKSRQTMAYFKRSKDANKLIEEFQVRLLRALEPQQRQVGINIGHLGIRKTNHCVSFSSNQHSFNAQPTAALRRGRALRAL